MLLAIRFLAMMAYRTTRMTNGSRKNNDMVIRKNVTVHTLEALVRQTAALLPSGYSSTLYSANNRIGLESGSRPGTQAGF